MLISDWSSDVCSSDLLQCLRPSRQSGGVDRARPRLALLLQLPQLGLPQRRQPDGRARRGELLRSRQEEMRPRADRGGVCGRGRNPTLRIWRSEEHTSELQSLMRISYAVFCLKKKKITSTNHDNMRLDT